MPDPVRSFDRIKIPAPCNADWDFMIGNDQVRFCEHCNLQVNNLSNMTRQEAIRLVARSQGRLCVRYVQRPNGSVLTKQIPQKLFRIGRRVSRVAAGGFTAMLSLSTAGAQTSSQVQGIWPTEVEQVAQDVLRKRGQAKSSAGLCGTITDQNEAVIPGATITLIKDDSQNEQTTNSSESGEYSFQNLAAGNYTLRVSAAGFATAEVTSVQLASDTAQRVDAKLEVGVALSGAIDIVEPDEPIVKAAFKEDLEVVRQLAFASLDVNVRDRFTNMTALDQAAENGNLEMVRTLLLAGAKANVRNKGGRTPLMYLRENATADLVRELLSAGARINARDESGGTPLMNAASLCNYAVVKELIENGAKTDLKDVDGKTALMFAAANDDPRIAKLLIDAGASVNTKDKDGKTALMIAADEGDSETVRLLIGFNAEINETDNDGWTALMYAASVKDLESIEALLNAGADLSVRDKEGRTALVLARRTENQEVIKALESRGAPE